MCGSHLRVLARQARETGSAEWEHQHAEAVLVEREGCVCVCAVTGVLVDGSWWAARCGSHMCLLCYIESPAGHGDVKAS